MKRIRCIILCLLLFLACQNRDNIIEYDRVVKLSGLAEMELENNIDVLFSKRKYIILNDTKKIYPAKINQILVRNDKLYIHSRSNRKDELLVFDINGDALYRVGEIGRAYNEYLGIDGFDIDSCNNVYINDLRSKKTLKFDCHGVFLENITFADSDIYRIKVFNTNKYLLCLAPWNTHPQKDELIFVDNDERSTITYYRDKLDDNYLISSPNFTVVKDHVYFKNDLNDIIYVFDSNGNIKERVKFDFGADTVPNSKKVNLEQRIENEREYEKYSTLSKFCCEDSRYIYGELYERMIYKNFVYDKQTKTIYKIDRNKGSHIGEIVGFDNKYLISFMDIITYDKNPNIYSDELSIALRSGKIVLCLYYN